MHRPEMACNMYAVLLYNLYTYTDLLHAQRICRLVVVVQVIAAAVASHLGLYMCLFLKFLPHPAHSSVKARWRRLEVEQRGEEESWCKVQRTIHIQG